MNNNLKILIVEDDECSRKLLNILVKRVSSNISNVVNGIEAGAFPMTRTYGFNLKLSF